MSDTITLRRDGIEATVRVGDVVPMTDGSHWYFFERRGACLMLHKPGTGPGLTSFYTNGNPCLGSGLPAIDIAKLAEQQAALARPAAVPAKAIRALVAEWQQIAAERRMALRSKDGPEHLRVMWFLKAEEAERCAADLLKLLEAHNG